MDNDAAVAGAFGLGTVLGIAVLVGFCGVLAGQALQRNAQRLEKIEGRYWDLYHRVDPQVQDTGREAFKATVGEAVAEALRRDRTEA